MTTGGATGGVVEVARADGTRPPRRDDRQADGVTNAMVSSCCTRPKVTRGGEGERGGKGEGAGGGGTHRTKPLQPAGSDSSKDLSTAESTGTRRVSCEAPATPANMPRGRPRSAPPDSAPATACAQRKRGGAGADNAAVVDPAHYSTRRRRYTRVAVRVGPAVSHSAANHAVSPIQS